MKLEADLHQWDWGSIQDHKFRAIITIDLEYLKELPASIIWREQGLRHSASRCLGIRDQQSKGVDQEEE
jgi:hypothetical protein